MSVWSVVYHKKGGWLMIAYLCVLFVGDGLKIYPRLIVQEHVELGRNREKAREVHSTKFLTLVGGDYGGSFIY
jgi:hypothetical protein